MEQSQAHTEMVEERFETGERASSFFENPLAKPILDESDLSKLLGVSPSTIDRLITSGKLRVRYIGKQRRYYYPEVLQAFLSGQFNLERQTDDTKNQEQGRISEISGSNHGARPTSLQEIRKSRRGSTLGY